ncbi:MAG: ATP-dependent Clp protease ATP-binding subunit, partial [Terriglobales bacterium]
GLQRRLEAVALAAARRKFSPEFFNRLDHVVVFRPLDRPQLERVLDLELNAVRVRLATGQSEHPVEFRCTARARAHLLAAGADPKYGARHLKRAIERLLVAPLASLIATHQVGGESGAGDRIVVDHDSGAEGLDFAREGAAAAGRGTGNH